MEDVLEATIKRGFLSPDYMHPAWRAELEQACPPGSLGPPPPASSPCPMPPSLLAARALRCQVPCALTNNAPPGNLAVFDAPQGIVESLRAARRQLQSFRAAVSRRPW